MTDRNQDVAVGGVQPTDTASFSERLRRILIAEVVRGEIGISADEASDSFFGAAQDFLAVGTGLSSIRTESRRELTRFLQDPKLWTPIRDASTLSEAIDIAFFDIFPRLAQVGPGLLDTDESRLLAIREALTVGDQRQTDLNQTALDNSRTVAAFSDQDKESLSDALTVSTRIETETEEELEAQKLALAESLAAANITGSAAADIINAAFDPVPDVPGDAITPIPFIGGLPAQFRAPVPFEEIRQTEIQVGLGPFRAPVPASQRGAIQVEPRYREFDQWNLFRGLSDVQIASLQVELVRTGQLGVNDFTPGFWDGPSADAMRTVMAFANVTGRSYQNSLIVMSDFAKDTAEDVRRVERQVTPTSIFQSRTFRAPNPATLANQVFGTFKQFLGRDPNRDELTGMMQILADATLAQFRSEETADFGEAKATAETQRALDEKRRREERRISGDTAPTAEDKAKRIAAGLPPPPKSRQITFAESNADLFAPRTPTTDPAIVATTPSAQAPTFDPAAQFLAAFRERFSGEIAFRERQQGNTNLRSITQGGFLSLLSAIKNNPFA